MSLIGTRLFKPKKKRISPATGIRRKIRYGFIILGILLFFSGLISLFELSRLTRTTQDLMDISVRDLTLSKNMLDGLSEQNAALFMGLHADLAPDSINTDSLFIVGQAHFDAAYREAETQKVHQSRLEAISKTKSAYDAALGQLPEVESGGDSLRWYNQYYRIAYYDLALAVKDLMIDSQATIDRNTQKIEGNAYRALMPGIITLAIAIIIIFVFYTLIDFYYIRPVLKIRQGLRNYLENKLPYTVQIEGKDEIKELSDQIATLMTLVKKKENNA